MKKYLDVIKESHRLLEYKEDWNDDEASPINHKAFALAMLWLYLVVEKLPSFDSIPIPDIGACPDGSIDVEYHSDNGYRLLINFKEKSAACYGHNGYDKNQINLSEVKCKSLFDWMEQYLPTNQTQ